MSRPYKRGLPITLAERRALVALANANLIEHEFSIKCFDCPKQLRQFIGPVRITAINRAVSHVKIRSGHTVYIYDYDLCVSKREFAMLPEASDEVDKRSGG